MKSSSDLGEFLQGQHHQLDQLTGRTGLLDGHGHAISDAAHARGGDPKGVTTHGFFDG